MANKVEEAVESVTKLFDPYDRKARLYPALLTLAPILVLLVCVFGDKASGKSVVVSVLISCGVLFWIARIARNLGMSIQEEMWKPWGGTPTVRYLRHRETTVVDEITRERYHHVLSEGIGKPFPSADEEQRDPDAADKLYRSGLKWLMEQTRDTKKYSLLFKENIAYGFHRNMLGIKPVALVIALISMIFSVLWTGLVITEPPYLHVALFSECKFEQAVALILPTLALLCWIFGATKDGVEKASAAYAERLLQTCEGMYKATAKKAAKPRTKAKEKTDEA